MNTITLNNVATMTSLEIAELTGKEHFIVMRDIRALAEELGVEYKFVLSSKPHENGRSYDFYILEKDECLTLVSGYNAKMRFAIIKRWQALEAQSAQIQQTASFASLANDCLLFAKNVAESFRMSEAAKLNLARTIITDHAPAMLAYLPSYAIDAPTDAPQSSSAVCHALTHLPKENGIEGSAVSWNRRLLSHGMIKQEFRNGAYGTKRAYWSITDKGQAYGKNVTAASNLKETQPHWYDSKFNQLINLLTAGVKS